MWWYNYDIRGFVDIDLDSVFTVIDCKTSYTRGHNLRLFKDHCNIVVLILLSVETVVILMFTIVCQLMLYIMIVSRCLNASFSAWICEWVNFRFLRKLCSAMFQSACFLLLKQINDLIWFDLYLCHSIGHIWVPISRIILLLYLQLSQRCHYFVSL